MTGFATPMSRTASNPSSVISDDTVGSEDHGRPTKMLDDQLEHRREYRREALSDAPSLLELPVNRPRVAERFLNGAQIRVSINFQLRQQLTNLAHRHGLSLADVVLVGWAVTLSRLTTQEDVVICVSAKVAEKDDKGGIALPSSTLPLRFDLSGEPSIVQLFGHLRDILPAARAHQVMPLERIIDSVLPQPAKGYSPLFQAAFHWHDSTYSLAAQLANDELHLLDRGEEVSGTFHNTAALFEHKAIQRHVEFLPAVLGAMVTDPTQSVSMFDILSTEERSLILDTWNATTVAYPDHLRVDRLFEEQVEKAPEAIAIVHDDKSLTYGDVNARADRLELQLVDAGIKPGDFVGTFIQRSFELILAQLAIFKAGAVFVPIDPKAPVDRQAYILKDSSAG
ncbi:hypothetical protein CPB97_005444, partial [Podila verticillata]